MKILAGRSAFLSLLTLFVGLFYVQPTVSEAFDIANESREGIHTTEINNNLFEATENLSKENSDDTKALTEAKVEKSGLKTGLFRATAYCLKGRTANGGGVRRGVVAAD